MVARERPFCYTNNNDFGGIREYILRDTHTQ